jgi:hypothetical protein
VRLAETAGGISLGLVLLAGLNRCAGFFGVRRFIGSGRIFGRR